MRKNGIPGLTKSNSFYRLVLLLASCLVLLPAVSLAIDHPTSNPYETRPAPDGYLAYEIIPTPGGLTIERDVMVTMQDGVKLACNVYRPDKPGRFPVIVAMTPYGKDQTPPVFNQDGSFLPNAYGPYVLRVYSQGADLGHMKISLLTPWEGPDPAFWVSNDYVVVIADQRGGFKSEGKMPSPNQGGDDLFYLIEWAAAQEWSNGNVGMAGVSAMTTLRLLHSWAAAH